MAKRSNDDPFEKEDHESPGSPAPVDMEALMQAVFESGGDVFICNSGETRLKREQADVCPHCSAPLDKRRYYTCCPVCSRGILGHKKERKG